MPSPKRHHKARRILLYASALLTLLSLALYIATFTRYRTSHLVAGPVRPYIRPGPPDPNDLKAMWQRDETHHVLADGWYQRRFYPVHTGGDFSLEPTKTLNSDALQWATYENNARGISFLWRHSPDATIAIPLWPPILLFGTLTFFLFRRNRRLSTIGHCLNCLYDLRSLPADALCPECGSDKRIGP